MNYWQDDAEMQAEFFDNLNKSEQEHRFIDEIKTFDLEKVENLIKNENYSRPLIMRALLERKNEILSS